MLVNQFKLVDTLQAENRELHTVEKCHKLVDSVVLEQSLLCRLLDLSISALRRGLLRGAP